MNEVGKSVYVVGGVLWIAIGIACPATALNELLKCNEDSLFIHVVGGGHTSSSLSAGNQAQYPATA